MIGGKWQMSNPTSGKAIISKKNYIPPDKICAWRPQYVMNKESVSQIHAIDKIVQARTSIG